jgi:virginiamycin B lyase
VAVAPDGTVWGTLQAGNQLVRISGSGEMTEQELPTRSSSPTDVAVDGSGNVWVVEFRANKIARFANGKFTEYELPPTQAAISGLAVAQDGSIWFGLVRSASLGRLRNGEMSFFRLPREDARPYSVAIDQKGNVWYADIKGYVGMIPSAQAR